LARHIHPVFLASDAGFIFYTPYFVCLAKKLKQRVFYPKLRASLVL